MRHMLRPGDLGQLIWLHGTLHGAECGFDPTFEAYVAGPMAEVVRRGSPGDRIWIAERSPEEGGAVLGARIVGCIALVSVSAREGQLRWYLVVPAVRRMGLGTALLHTALEFARRQRYETVFLWTVSALTAAARLYRLFGFAKVAERPGRLWGVEVVEERYELRLGADG